MPKDYKRVVTDVTDLVLELEAAQTHIARLKAQLHDLGVEPCSDVGWHPILFKRCDELDLSVRSQNCLQYAGVEFIYQLVEMTDATLLKQKNFSQKSLKEIREVLRDLGLSLNTKLPDDFSRVPRSQ